MSTELVKRCAFTLGALLVWLLGISIPIPGVDVSAWAALFQAQSGGILGQANSLSGGAVGRLSVISLSITPYVTSALIVQLLAMVFPPLTRLRNDGERGRAIMLRYIRFGTLLLAALQAYGIALGLEGVGRLVPEPGALFRLTTVLTLVAGALFLMWLADQITARGIGNGIALILAAGIIRTAPANLAGLIELSRRGAVSPGAVLEVVLGFAILTVVVALVERSRRRLPVVFAERRAGMQGQTAVIALKLNPTGLMPVYIVGLVFTIVLLLVTLASLLWSTPVNVAVSVPVRLLITAVLIVFFTFLYTAFVCDPEQMAARLAACGGELPGIAPGEETAAYLDGAISRMAALGAVYLLSVILLPELLGRFLGLPITLDGTPVLLLVCVVLDLAAEFRAYRARPE